MATIGARDVGSGITHTTGTDNDVGDTDNFSSETSVDNTLESISDNDDCKRESQLGD